MSEEEIISSINALILYASCQKDSGEKYKKVAVDNIDIQALKGILDLYNKEKEKNNELKEEKKLNEEIIYLANNTISSYHEGYQAGLHKEITATEILAEEREKFIIGQKIKRLKNTIIELHNKLDEGNSKVERDYISKDKIIEFIKNELPDDEIMQCCETYDSNGVYLRKKLEELLEE